MGFDLTRLRDELVSAGKEVGEKVSDASIVAKKKIDILSKEDVLEKQFAELGRDYYYQNKEKDEEKSDLFAEIAATEDEIQKLKDEILKIQGSAECPSCGTKQSSDHSFCTNCGSSMTQTEEAEQTEEAAQNEATEQTEEAAQNEAAEKTEEKENNDNVFED